ncbi:MAG: fused MFS/spermidine synthase [Candidatus Altiarchaeota archaeon]
MRKKTSNQPRSRAFLLGSAFLAGASVMSLELCASRILSPGFGGGIYVWGSLIGVIMAAMSLGYWIGGRWADDRKDPKRPYKALILSGIIVSLTPTVGYAIVAVCTYAGLIFGPLISSVMIFAAPMTLVSTVSPMVIKREARNLSTVGGSAGKVFAISTVGSIIGTFATAFLLLPYLGTRATLLSNALLLCALGCIGVYERNSALLAMFMLPGFLYQPPYLQAEGLIYRGESAYNIISVVDSPNSRILRMNWDLFLIQSYQNKNGPLTGYYFDNYLLGPPMSGGNKVLFIGMAGGVAVNQLLGFYDVDVDAVEIDPSVVDVAKEYFNVTEGPRLRIFVSDGRQFLKGSGKYDVIDVDAFNGADIPTHMSSAEFFKDAYGHLNDDGILMMNVLNIKNDRKLSHAVANTMKTAFPSVFLVNSSRNDILIACKGKKTKQQLTEGLTRANNPRMEPIIYNFNEYAVEYNQEGGDIFTDDKTDIEELTFEQMKALG